MENARKAALLNHLATLSLLALVVLCLAWELWLAPLRPGGSWLVLKVLPLLAPLRGILRARRYTHQWAALLALAYFVEGVVRAGSDRGISTALAMGEVALALLLFLSTAFFARLSAPKRADGYTAAPSSSADTNVPAPK